MDVCLHEIGAARKSGAIVAQFPGQVTEFRATGAPALAGCAVSLEMGTHEGMIEGEQHASAQAVADDPKTRDIVWRLLEKSLELTLPQLFDLKELKATAKTQAEVEKGGAKKNWAPF